MNKYLAASVILLLLVSILLSINSIRQKRMLSEKVCALSDVEQEKRSLLDLVYGNMKMHYAYAEFHFQDFILLDKERNKVKFSTIIGSSAKVIYKFSSSNCSSCIQSGLASIQKLIRKIPENQLIIVADGSTRRELQALSNSLHLNYPIYLTEDGAFDTILRKENIPFMFVVGPDMQMKDLFIPMKELPEYSEMYYHTIWRKYFKQ